MAEIRIFWSDRIKTGKRREHFPQFVQRMANRLMQGSARYGTEVRREHRYLTRMTVELKAYKRTGNAEHLHNIANYCVLESIAPEHARFHFDAGVESVAREVGREVGVGRVVREREVREGD